jgi:hypothetical protein
MYRSVFAAVAAIALAQGAAYAQNNDATSKMDNSGATVNSSSTENNQTLPQEIKQKLKDEGFTDVQVVPGSFIVSAKDKSGDPVTMVIGPHSMMVLTVNNSETTGSSSASGSGDSNPSK